MWSREVGGVTRNTYLSSPFSGLHLLVERNQLLPADTHTHTPGNGSDTHREREVLLSLEVQSPHPNQVLHQSVS